MRHIDHTGRGTGAEWPSREWDLVACCCRRADRFAGSVDGARVRELLAAGVDGARVAQIAAGHGVAGLVASNLAGVSGVDAQVVGPCGALLAHQAATNGVLEGVARRVIELLGRQGVAVVPFKGPLLARAAYADLGARRCGDLDFLVRPGDLERVASLLTQAGYAPRRAAGDRLGARQRAAGWGCEFRDAATGVWLEFNDALAPRFMGFRLDGGALLDSARPTVIGTGAVPWPEPELLVLALCVHGTKHLWRRLQWIADIRACWDAWPELDAARLLRLADAHGLRRVLLLAHWLVQALWGGTWPPVLATALAADRRVPALGRHCLALLRGATPAGRGAEWRLLWGVRDRVRDRWAYAAAWILQPSWSDWQLVALPRRLEWGYAAIRPVRLGFKLARAAMMPYKHARKRSAAAGGRHREPGIEETTQR